MEIDSVQHEVQKLRRLLERDRGKFITAAQIARRLRWSRPTAHRRLKDLRKELKLQSKKVRQGARGPRSIAYAIA